jgi:hypothetical protein
LKLDKRISWIEENVLTWREVEWHFRTVSALLDQVIVRYMDDTERADFWTEMLRAVAQEAYINGYPR